MTSPTVYSELAGRVAEATGADRELDAALALAVGGFTFEKRKGDAKPYWRDSHGKSFGADGWQPRRTLPMFSDSVDEALALVERVLPGAMRRLQDASDGTGDGEATLVLTNGSVVTGRGRTWPLAILAALLSALAAQAGPLWGGEER